MEYDLPSSEIPRPAWWKSSVIWSVLFLAALLIYEITAKPLLGVLLLCSKFGWDYFLAAYWLRRVDPNRMRAKSIFWLLLTMGMFNIANAASAFFLLFSLVFVVFKIHNRAAFFPDEILIALGTWCVGIFICILTTFLGLWNTFRGRLRIWLPSPSFYTTSGGKENVAEIMLIMEVLVAGIICLELSGLIGGVLDPQGANNFAVAGLWILTVTAMTGLLFKAFAVLKNRLIAEHPNQCWDDDWVGDVMVSQMPIERKWRVLASGQHAPKRGLQWPKS
jgi:hypothetical protein